MAQRHSAEQAFDEATLRMVEHVAWAN